MKPYVICLMITSPDGSLHPSRWTKSPDGTRENWSSLYDQVHKDLNANAWMVGRVTMAEISKAAPHAPSVVRGVARPSHYANPSASSFAIAVDQSGKLHFSSGELYGDHVVVLLGADVDDRHLAELAADGVSYIVSDTPQIDMSAMLSTLSSDLGIKRLILEGGANINGTLMAEGLVDELSLIVAPALEARRGSDRIVEFGDEGLTGKVTLSLIACEPLQYGALHLRYAVQKAA